MSLQHVSQFQTIGGLWICFIAVFLTENMTDICDNFLGISLDSISYIKEFIDHGNILLSLLSSVPLMPKVIKAVHALTNKCNSFQSTYEGQRIDDTAAMNFYAPDSGENSHSRRVAILSNSINHIFRFS